MFTSPHLVPSKNESMNSLEIQSARLQRAALAFCKILSPAATAKVLLDFLLELPGSYAGIVAIRHSNQELRAIHLRGYPPAIEEKLARISFDTAHPLVDAARYEKPLFLATAEEFFGAYPNCVGLESMSLTQAIAAIPFAMDEKRLGSVAISFSLPIDFTPGLRTHLESLVAMAVQAFERARLIEEMQNLNDRYATAVEVGQLGLWEMDLATQKVHCFGQYDQLMGHSTPLPEWTPQMFMDRVHRDDLARVEHEAAEAFSGEHAGRRAKTFRVQWPDESYHWLEGHWKLIKDSAGNPKTLRGVLTDITQLKETELQLQRAVRIRDEFVAMASHELKTPLTALKLHLGLLELELEMLKSTPPATFKRVKSVDHQANRLKNLINQLLDVSRIQSGKLPFQFKAFDLASCARELSEPYIASLNQTRERFTLNAPSSLTLIGDQLRVEQLIDNLVANAVRHGNEASIQVKVEKRDEEALIIVKDDGPGIAENAQTRIFERYEQGASQSRTLGGLGLGLYIVREIVQAHGGSIQLESAPGKGTSFYIALPLAGPRH